MIVYFINQLIDFFFQYNFVLCWNLISTMLTQVLLAIRCSSCLCIYVSFPYFCKNSDKFEVDSFGSIGHKPWIDYLNLSTRIDTCETV